MVIFYSCVSLPEGTENLVLNIPKLSQIESEKKKKKSDLLRDIIRIGLKIVCDLYPQNFHGFIMIVSLTRAMCTPHF